MSQSDDPFEEKDLKKPENEKNVSESLDADLPSDEDDDVIDLLTPSEAPDDEEILELEETVDQEEDVIELTSKAEEVAGEDEEDFIDLTSEIDEGVAKPAETAPAMDQEAVELDEDKQILELIDDIQSTLDETADTGEEAEQTPVMDDTGEPADQEESFEESILLGDEETVETDDLSDSESEFVDHLGLDLTSEFSKEILREDSETSALFIEKIEQVIVRVIHNMLSDENSSLIQAIKKTAKKEIE